MKRELRYWLNAGIGVSYLTAGAWAGLTLFEHLLPVAPGMTTFCWVVLAMWAFNGVAVSIDEMDKC